MSPPRILLVDDEQHFRELLAVLLRADLGAQIVGQAADGATAVELAREHRPDFVVMDLRMPTMDGFEATRRIVAALPAVRVVVVSSSSEPDDVERATAAGACAYLSKDRAVTELAGELERLRTRSRRSPLQLLFSRRLVFG